MKIKINNYGVNVTYVWKMFAIDFETNEFKPAPIF